MLNQDIERQLIHHQKKERKMTPKYAHSTAITSDSNRELTVKADNIKGLNTSVIKKRLQFFILRNLRKISNWQTLRCW